MSEKTKKETMETVKEAEETMDPVEETGDVDDDAECKCVVVEEPEEGVLSRAKRVTKKVAPMVAKGALLVCAAVLGYKLGGSKSGKDNDNDGDCTYIEDSTDAGDTESDEI